MLTYAAAAAAPQPPAAAAAPTAKPPAKPASRAGGGGGGLFGDRPGGEVGQSLFREGGSSKTERGRYSCVCVC